MLAHRDPAVCFNSIDSKFLLARFPRPRRLRPHRCHRFLGLPARHGRHSRHRYSRYSQYSSRDNICSRGNNPAGRRAGLPVRARRAGGHLPFSRTPRRPCGAGPGNSRRRAMPPTTSSIRIRRCCIGRARVLSRRRFDASPGSVRMPCASLCKCAGGASAGSDLARREREF